MEAVYRSMQRARTGAARAAGILATTAPTPTFNRGEMYMVLAYTELFFGEGWCSGVPFSSEDGTTTTFGKPMKTDEMWTLASAHFDSALALADTSKRVKFGSQIGKARALMNLGKFTEAAAAVAGVPTNFVLTTSHSPNSGVGRRSGRARRAVPRAIVSSRTRARTVCRSWARPPRTSRAFPGRRRRAPGSAASSRISRTRASTASTPTASLRRAQRRD